MKKYFKYALIALCAASFVACSDDDDKTDEATEKPVVSEGLFILNQGNYYYQIEGSMTQVDYASQTSATEVFQKANGRSLGSTPQDAVVYGSKVYIGVYESNVIEIVDRTTCKSLKQISLSDAEGQSPRSLVAKDGKVYISMYNGYVSRLDTASLAIDKTVKVGPNPEIMTIKGNHLYVPNSDGMNWAVGYGTTASVIDLATFTVEKTMTVGLNPCEFATNGTDLFLLCKGNYSDVASKLYRVTDNEEMEEVAECTYFALKDNKLYCINAPYMMPVEYAVYDTQTYAKSALVSDDGVDYPAGIGVDPVNGNIVILSYVLNNGYADYSANGYAKVYSSNGDFLFSCEAGVCPSAVVFK